ncbi:GNAT family N-acetyltransferase [Ktedonosporobacter rubrisoli]|uniref:GNAT family N-acetyltransferase n=1 Tax=Ktedonosporobacter rubrisoli TaxID=2509675 RepID=A0A4P6JND7_KTERU|nr:GNAT family N-acetyltransferase [Ktedonosporobacter rubrisoli]QBD76819.1 GNAT family N-acetyltransferase [Ktedonosporobacter rubrisoli]
MEQDHSKRPREVYCEDVTDEVVASWAEQGYTLAFAEEVMRYNLSQGLPRVVVPFEVSYLAWEAAHIHDFFSLYVASFRERPGFPEWDEACWLQWVSDDPAFRADLSFLALVQGQAVGFITNAEDEEEPARCGYLIQVGIHPKWRGRRLGTVLITHALQAWRAVGREAVLLHVNVNNPGAIRLYQQLGFVCIRRRGKFIEQMK